jgi:hypothetical protein
MQPCGKEMLERPENWLVCCYPVQPHRGAGFPETKACALLMSMKRSCCGAGFPETKACALLMSMKHSWPCAHKIEALNTK